MIQKAAPVALSIVALLCVPGCTEDPAAVTHTSATTSATASSSVQPVVASSHPERPVAEGTVEPSNGSASAAPTSSAAAPDAGARGDASSGKAVTSSAPKSKSTPDASVADSGTSSKEHKEPTAVDAGSVDAGSSLSDKPPQLPAPAEGSADAIAASADKIFIGRTTFTAKFKQEHTQKVSGIVKRASGVCFVEKPNKISFRYDPPNKNRIVSDGKTLKIYVAEDNQMFVHPIEKTEYPGALSFLMGHGLRPSFTFTFNEKAKFDGGPVLIGKPRSPTPHYESVLFYVDKALLEKSDPGVIRRVLILDAQGNRNRFDFEDVKQPDKIDPVEFTFTPPEGTNVVQN